MPTIVLSISPHEEPVLPWACGSRRRRPRRTCRTLRPSPLQRHAHRERPGRTSDGMGDTTRDVHGVSGPQREPVERAILDGVGESGLYSQRPAALGQRRLQTARVTVGPPRGRTGAERGRVTTVRVRARPHRFDPGQHE